MTKLSPLFHQGIFAAKNSFGAAFFGNVFINNEGVSLMVQTGYDYNVYIPPGYTGEVKVLPPKGSVPNGMEAVRTRLTEEAAFDHVEINRKFQAQFDPNATPYTIGETPTPTGEQEPLTWRTGSPYLEQYRRCEADAACGKINDYFFYLDASMIEDQANKVLGGTAYEGDSVHDLFVRGLNEWFGESNTAATTASFDALVNEYAELRKAGETPSMVQLKTKFTFCGERLSISEIFQMRDVARALNDVNADVGPSTEIHITAAKLGMMKVAAQDYAKTLPQGIQNTFSEKLANMIDSANRYEMQHWVSTKYEDGTITTERFDRATPAANYAYQLFSESSLTQESVQSNINKLTEAFKGDYSDEFVQTCNRDIMAAYQQIAKAIGAKTVSS